jgi:hypothetical protein
MSLNMKELIAGALLAVAAVAADPAAVGAKKCTGLCQEPHEQYPVGSPRMYGIMEQKT